MVISEVVKEALKNLDTFNLEVAEFRVKYGMSPDLRRLYTQMGRLCNKLLELEIDVRNIEDLDNRICDVFKSVKMWEEGKEVEGEREDSSSGG